MAKKLKDKVCIITGATSGIGRSIALLFAQNGAALVLSGRNVERGNELVETLAPKNKNLVFLPTDVRKVGDNKKLVETAISHFGKLDILSINAGILGLGPVTTLSVASWQKTMDTNLNSLFYLSKYAVPHLIKNGNGNIIINASIAAFKSFPNHPAYCASKAATVALMKQMAVEYGPDLRANAICPGPVDTPLLWNSATAFKDPKSAVENVKNATLLNRLGTPKDIANLALFLASEDSAWITGATINIDGGILNSS